MPRLTISLPETLYIRIERIARYQDESMSHVINQLIQTGLFQWQNGQFSSEHPPRQLLEQHCQQLIIQMNALIKSMSAELLKLKQEDFEQLNQAAAGKVNELIEANQGT